MVNINLTASSPDYPVRCFIFFYSGKQYQKICDGSISVVTDPSYVCSKKNCERSSCNIPLAFNLLRASHNHHRSLWHMFLIFNEFRM